MPNEEIAKCQHCHQAVEYGMTEHGFRGFVHVSTGTTPCPTESTDD